MPLGVPARRSCPGRVLPDACMDIIWDGSSVFVAGPDTAPVTVEPRPGLVFCGVRFLPGRAPGFLGTPASELLDERIALEELWGRAAVAELTDQLVRAPSAEGAAGVLEGAVLSRAGTARAPDTVVDALVALLCTQLTAATPHVTPQGGVREVARALGVGERRLHRRCCAAVGYGPKTLERVLRFQGALRLARRTTSLAILAASAGYADQAHLTRESRRLAGTTPSDLFKTTAASFP